MRTKAANLNHLWGDLLVEEFYRQGCSLFCVSPGSRSSPLTVAAARHPGVDAPVFFDERAAAFFALGYGRATGKPAVLMCTSGTAAANYLPAVIEASADRVPMIICSADRPPELLQSGANQAIQQAGLFGVYPRWQTTLPCPSLEVPARSLLTTVDQAYFKACCSPAGPVHLNCMFREPLAPEVQEVPESYYASMNEWASKSEPLTRWTPHSGAVSKPDLHALVAEINCARKGVLLVGRLPSSLDTAAIESFCERLGWPTVADIGSGLRIRCAGWPYITAHDMLLRQANWRSSMNPDLILHLGGPLVSKHTLRFIEENPQARYIQVHSHSERMDPTHHVSWRIEGEPTRVCRDALAGLRTASDNEWIETWRQTEQTLKGSLLQRIQVASFCEPAIAYHLSNHLPDSHCLFLGNSMPIRDWDLFATGRGQQINVAANRGASGIDGLVASALGMVRGAGKSGTLVLGDLSLLHDLNSLLLLQQTQLPLTVVVNNNQGGGIFEFLPIAKFKDVFDSHFVAAHNHSIAPIAQSIGLQATQVRSMDELVEVYQEAISSERPALIEIETKRQQNTDFHRSFARCVSQILMEGNSDDPA